MFTDSDLFKKKVSIVPYSPHFGAIRLESGETNHGGAMRLGTELGPSLFAFVVGNL